MISKIYNEILKYITLYFKQYGFNIQSQYNSDIGIIKQYVSSINYRYMYKDMKLLDDDTLKLLNKNSYILMLYKYSPIKKNSDMLNNINLEVVFNPNSKPGVFELTKIPDKNVLAFCKDIRKTNEDNLTEDLQYPVRNLVYTDMEMEFEIMCTDTNMINNLQFMYLFEFANKLKGFNIEFIIDDDMEPIVFNYNIKFDEIGDIGQIDHQSYGNLQHLTFNATVTGPILSNFETYVKPIKQVNLVVDFLPKSEYDDKLLHS